MKKGLLATLGAVAIAFSLVGHAGAAVPEPADPVVSVLAPAYDETVAPVCGLVPLSEFALQLAPMQLAAMVGPILPTEAFLLVFGAYDTVSGGVAGAGTTACTAVPARQYETTCDVDHQIAGVITSVPNPGLPVSIGALLPLSPSLGPLGAVFDTLAALEREALGLAGLPQTAAAPLGCATVDRLAPQNPDTQTSQDTASAATEPPAAETTRVFDRTLDLPPRSSAPLGRGAAAVAAPAPTTATAAATPADTTGRSNTFRILFVLGLAAAAIGLAYAGRQPAEAS